MKIGMHYMKVKTTLRQKIIYETQLIHKKEIKYIYILIIHISYILLMQ
jgi:hypothetical protein